MTPELDAVVYARITKLTDKGNRLAESGDTLAAWKTFLDALELVPEPKTDWEAATWLGYRACLPR